MKARFLARICAATFIAVFIGATSGVAADDSGWEAWTKELNHTCPTRHVDWGCDGCWTQLTGAFEERLAPRTRTRITHIADSRRRCANERAGVSCEMGRSLVAYERLGLLDRFTGFACKVVRCEEPGLCSRFPDHPP
jgi:hypothetical protein